MANDFKPAFIVFASAILGFLMAALEYMLYEAEYIIHYYAQSSEEITGLMIVTILVWILLGGVLAAVSQR